VPSRDTATFRCDGPPPVRTALYLALARAISATPGPSGAVLEAVDGGPSAQVTVRPAHLASDLRAAADGAVGPTDPGPTPRSPEPPNGWPDRLGYLAPSASAVPWRPEAVAAAAPPGTEATAEWLAVQTFWIRGTHGELCVARRFRHARADGDPLGDRYDLVARRLAEAWAAALERPAVALPGRLGARRGWRRRSVRDLPPAAWSVRDPVAIVRTAEPVRPISRSDPLATAGPTVVFGASGAGKTTYLAHRSAEAIASGDRVVAIDLHGDLVPAIVARLGDAHRDRVVAVDAGERPVAGIAALAPDADDDRAAAFFVAAVKRLTTDGSELYWGFRLERLFDAFVRLARESGGSLLDVYDLLTSPERRESARLATRRPELGRFLDEVEPVVRRNPEFLWPAATRLSKVVLVPALAELLAPADGGLAVEALLAAGRSLLVRLPLARLGPEAASFAGTLVLARVFLGLVARGTGGPAPSPVMVVLDEVQAFSAPLVAELLAEGRKFGLRSVVATQYPERLAPELRHAAAGVATRLVVFRVPVASVAEAGAWLGLPPVDASRVLTELPTGRAVVRDPEAGALRFLERSPTATADPGPAWSEAVRRARAAVPDALPSVGGPDEGGAAERLLLAVLGAEEEGRPVEERGVVRAALGLPGPPLDEARLADTWGSLVRRGWVALDGVGARLTVAGARAVGLSAPTNAARESAEHRRLLLATFRLFARRGYRIEILRQGRFDTTLPDAIYRQLPGASRRENPAEFARTVDRLRLGWAWRYFGGRDVHIEAEVSGALRPERIRRGWAKAAAHDAFVLFVVGDAPRARRVRRALDDGRVGRDRGGVWTLPPPGGCRPPNP
jgi:hypothetical protein